MATWYHSKRIWSAVTVWLAAVQFLPPLEASVSCECAVCLLSPLNVITMSSRKVVGIIPTVGTSNNSSTTVKSHVVRRSPSVRLTQHPNANSQKNVTNTVEKTASTSVSKAPTMTKTLWQTVTKTLGHHITAPSSKATTVNKKATEKRKTPGRIERGKEKVEKDGEKMVTSTGTESSGIYSGSEKSLENLHQITAQPSSSLTNKKLAKVSSSLTASTSPSGIPSATCSRMSNTLGRTVNSKQQARRPPLHNAGKFCASFCQHSTLNPVWWCYQ